ncbi:MAG: hypothetical protein ACR2QE_04025 [Acidimicrobiales bacterium]
MTIVLDASYTTGLEREWRRLAAAGTWWTGVQRVAIAATARAARDGDGTPTGDLSQAATDAAIRLSVDPHVDQRWIDDLVARGLALGPYVELLAIVTRISAIDSFFFGIGVDRPELPDALPGDPSRLVVEEAEIQGALVPTVGVPFPPTALSSVPAETDALMDLHEVLYLSMFEMGDQHLVKDLHRIQIEFVAARTSLLNDCFY